jgi:hypothetical protein
VSLSVATVPVAARLVAVALSVESPAVLADSEVGRLSFRSLTFGSRKRRADQWPMHRPFVLGAPCRRFFGVGGFDSFDSVGSWFFCGLVRRRRKNGRVVDHLFDYLFARHQRRRLGRLGGDERRCGGDRLLPSRRRHFGVLVLVLRVTRGAASLLYLVFDHRDDRVIRNAALARTVVV